MLIVFKGISEDNVLVFDAEYNEGELIQFSGLLFKRVDKEIFQISKSINLYVKLESDTKLNTFIEKFTGISNSFLKDFGVTLDEATVIIEEFIKTNGSLLIVSHGLTNDRMIMLNNGIDFYEDNENNDYKVYCTYNAAKRILKRDKKLTLKDIAEESGMFLDGCHNAFNDAWATVSVFSFLKKIEEEQKNEVLQ